jgi:hypothetical protein
MRAVRAPLRAIAAALLAAVLVLLPPAAGAAGRVALLIGNASYSNADFTLRNPVNDVKALGPALERLGFAVTTVADADRAGMRAALDAFARRLEGAEIGFFFYAGHGMQIGGENLLLGADLRGTSAQALADAAITLSEVRAVFEAADPGVGIIVLDACRDNPLAARGIIVGDGRGLAREPGGAGLLIAYATDPGNVALDGAGRNSVFTGALLEHIATPALDIRLMFGRVRQAVVLATQGRQVPWVEEAVLGEHVLNTEVTGDDIVAQVDRDVARWREVSGRIDPEPYRAYLAEFPDGLFREFAEQRLARFSMIPVGTPKAGGAASELAAFVDRENPERLTAALAILGFLPETRGAANRDALMAATEAWLARRETPEDFDGNALYTDAARLSVFLGTKLAQRIRTDIVALSSIDKAKAVAQAAFAEIEALAATDPAAEALLPMARLDLDAIGEAEFKVLARLDQSREYYDALIGSAGRSFGDLLTPALLGLEDGARSATGLEEDAERDIRLFLKHARLEQNEQTRGTLTWLSDFLPRD